MALTGNTKRDRAFRENIRPYNSSLAFASMRYTGKEYAFKSRGPYCFRISGHSISQIVPEDGNKPNFSQIYIYDQENELDNQLQNFKKLDRVLLKELQDMMKEVNPYVQLYCHVGDVIKENPAKDVKLILQAKSNQVDPCRYNLPTGTDIAVIMPTDQNQSASKRDIVVYKSANHHPSGQHLMTIDV